MKEIFEKQKIAIRHWLLGRGYYKAVEAMNFAEQFHTGKRKDGNHEFSHQVSQASLCRTLEKYLLYPEETFIVIFLHDTPEDYDLDFDIIENKFGSFVRKCLERITKKYRGIKKTNEVYYNDMSECPVSSIVKCFDRNHNLFTMLYGFTVEKRIEYIEETLEYFVPMLKKAKRKFPSQESAYENIKSIVTYQVNVYMALNKKDLEISK